MTGNDLLKALRARAGSCADAELRAELSEAVDQLEMGYAATRGVWKLREEIALLRQKLGTENADYEVAGEDGPVVYDCQKCGKSFREGCDCQRAEDKKRGEEDQMWWILVDLIRIPIDEVLAMTPEMRGKIIRFASKTKMFRRYFT